MRRVLIIIVVLLGVYACEPNNVDENIYQQPEAQSSQGSDDIEKGNACPPNDRNCNGIPDNEE